MTRTEKYHSRYEDVTKPWRRQVPRDFPEVVQSEGEKNEEANNVYRCKYVAGAWFRGSEGPDLQRGDNGTVRVPRVGGQVDVSRRWVPTILRRVLRPA
jgi:hypothetical protein